MVNLILWLSLLLIIIAVLLGFYQLIKGPMSFDRVVSVDLLSIITLSIIIFVAHLLDRVIYLDVSIVYGLLSFLGVMAVARYYEKGL